MHTRICTYTYLCVRERILEITSNECNLWPLFEFLNELLKKRREHYEKLEM